MELSYINNYLSETIKIIDIIDQQQIYKMWEILHNLKGRLFILGVGGSAGNASHAVNDFRKIMKIESYTPTDNVSEFSAIINDKNWDSSFYEYLKSSRLNKDDCIMVFSVGGGNKKTSHNIVIALMYAKEIGSKIVGIVGRDGGYTKKVSNVCLIIPMINKYTHTQHVESFQSIIWHLFCTMEK